LPARCLSLVVSSSPHSSPVGSPPHYHRIGCCHHVRHPWYHRARCRCRWNHQAGVHHHINLARACQAGRSHHVWHHTYHQAGFPHQRHQGAVCVVAGWIKCDLCYQFDNRCFGQVGWGQYACHNWYHEAGRRHHANHCCSTPCESSMASPASPSRVLATCASLP